MKNLKTLKKWDTHHHISPDFYLEFIKKNGYEDGLYGLPHTKWSEKLMLSWMDSINIEKSIMSISLPGVHFGDDKESREICRKSNNYMAELIKKHPNRLGGFAAMPLPDVKGSLTELEYALDKLKLDGIGIVSNLNYKYYGVEGLDKLEQYIITGDKAQRQASIRAMGSAEFLSNSSLHQRLKNILIVEYIALFSNIPHLLILQLPSLLP